MSRPAPQDLPLAAILQAFEPLGRVPIELTGHGAGLAGKGKLNAHGLWSLLVLGSENLATMQPTEEVHHVPGLGAWHVPGLGAWHGT